MHACGFKAGGASIPAFALLASMLSSLGAPGIFAQATGRGQKARTTNNSMAPVSANVLMPNRSPLVTFRILFMTGSAYDPKGKEGIAALTAAMLSEGGSRALPYEKIVEAMYPMATSFAAQTDKEMTVFTGTTHIDNLDKYYSLISQMLLDPGFRQQDFTRLKTQAINFLDKSLRNGNDEELGKEQLYNMIYTGHPYGHHNVGSISALEKLTVDDVRDFYKKHYTRGTLSIGMAGGYPSGFPQKVTADFARLPVGPDERIKVAPPALAPGTRIELIKRETRSTALSLGFPIPVTRAHQDWPALALVASYFGQHRSSNSFLYQQLREARGLNYGDYAYIEYFPRGMFQFEPDPNFGRQQQIFQIWIRPVEPQNGHFALRAALFELDKLVRNGITKVEFETTREFLSKYANVLMATQDAQLGYAIDSRYYGTGDFSTYVREQMAKLTLEDVNNAIKRYLASDKLRIAIVTRDAEALKEAIIANKPSPITYVSPPAKEFLDDDKLIENYKIDVRSENVNIVPVTEVFR
jgi:zinc protease